MSWLTRLVSRVHDRLTRRKMERVFARRTDAFGYAQSTYELTRQEAVAQAAAERPVANALEIGCGEGYLTERLAAFCDRLTAVDISPTGLARARARLTGGRVTFIEANVRTWIPPSSGFDLIVISDVLSYLGSRGDGLPLVQEPEFRLWLERVAGWLAPGGRLLLAHGFISPEEREVRAGYRARFEPLGLRLEREWEAGAGLDRAPAICLLSLLRKSEPERRPAAGGPGAA